MYLLNVYIGFSEILNILSILPSTLIHIMSVWVLIWGAILEVTELYIRRLNVEAFLETLFK